MTKKLEEHTIADAIIIMLVCAIILFMFVGCGTLNLHHTDYNDDGSISWETKVSYWRWFNQSLEGLEIINPLFSAKLAEQHADNDDAVKAISSGLVEGAGKVFAP